MLLISHLKTIVNIDLTLLTCLSRLMGRGNDPFFLKNVSCFSLSRKNNFNRLKVSQSQSIVCHIVVSFIFSGIKMNFLFLFLFLFSSTICTCNI